MEIFHTIRDNSEASKQTAVYFLFSSLIRCNWKIFQNLILDWVQNLRKLTLCINKLVDYFTFKVKLTLTLHHLGYQYYGASHRKTARSAQKIDLSLITQIYSSNDKKKFWLFHLLVKYLGHVYEDIFDWPTSHQVWSISHICNLVSYFHNEQLVDTSANRIRVDL